MPMPANHAGLRCGLTPASLQGALPVAVYVMQHALYREFAVSVGCGVRRFSFADTVALLLTACSPAGVSCAGPHHTQTLLRTPQNLCNATDALDICGTTCACPFGTVCASAGSLFPGKCRVSATWKAAGTQCGLPSTCACGRAGLLAQPEPSLTSALAFHARCHATPPRMRSVARAIKTAFAPPPSRTATWAQPRPPARSVLVVVLTWCTGDPAGPVRCLPGGRTTGRCYLKPLSRRC